MTCKFALADAILDDNIGSEAVILTTSADVGFETCALLFEIFNPSCRFLNCSVEVRGKRPRKLHRCNMSYWRSEPSVCLVGDVIQFSLLSSSIPDWSKPLV